MKKLWLVVLTLGLAAAGSATPAFAASKARIYNLSTGEVAVAEFHNKWQRGHGDIKITLGGQKLQGEFSTVAASELSWGSIYAQGVSAGCSRRTSQVHSVEKQSSLGAERYSGANTWSADLPCTDMGTARTIMTAGTS